VDRLGERKVLRKLVRPTAVNGHKPLVIKENPESPVEGDGRKRAAGEAEALKKL
jgi:hypothetical protein